MLVGIAVYFNSFAGVFMFDDVTFEDYAAIPDLSALGGVIKATRRPVVAVTLAINHLIGGLHDLWGYHALNLAVHILAALTLYGVVRRTLLLEYFQRRFDATAHWFGLGVALLWLVHPLQTESVTYIVQRAESIMGLFYLLTLYCVIRGATASRGRWWYLAAVLSCALGMGSKAILVTGPVVVLLFDWVFLEKPFGRALRSRWPLYLGLAMTWLVLVETRVLKGVLSSDMKGPATVGFSYKGISPSDYARTQPQVVLHYLRLGVWPDGLCLDYIWPVAKSTVDYVPQALLLAGLAACTVWGLLRRSWLGFVGAWFFVILSPTSSIVPIKDPAFEHRMYLPLAAQIVLFVFAGRSILRRIFGASAARPALAVLVVAASVALGLRTVDRNRDYHRRADMWADVIATRPDNWRGHCELGRALADEGALTEAIEAYREAIRIRPVYPIGHYDLGNALQDAGRMEEAAKEFRTAIAQRPRYPQAHINLGNALASLGRHEEAVKRYKEALRYRPKSVRARYNMANSLRDLHRYQEAIAYCKEVLELNPNHDRALNTLGLTYVNIKQPAEGVKYYRRAIEVNPKQPVAHHNLGIALSRLGETAEEMAAYREEAIASFRKALEIRPRDAVCHYRLGRLLEKHGDLDGAIVEYLDTLDINPQHQSAQRRYDALTNPDGNPAGG